MLKTVKFFSALSALFIFFLALQIGISKTEKIECVKLQKQIQEASYNIKVEIVNSLPKWQIDQCEANAIELY